MSQGAGYYIDSQGNKKKLFGGALVNVGHKIKNAFNTLMPQRAILKFGGYLNVSDDDENYMTVIDDAPIEVEWAVWKNMTDAQKTGKRWKIINAPASSLTGNDVAYDISLSVNEKIDSKVSKSGDTMTGQLNVNTSGAFPICVTDGGSGAIPYIQFNNSSGTLGYIGVNSSKKPVFYDTTSRQILLDSDVQIIKASSGSSNNAVVTVPSTPYATFEIVSPVMVYVGYNSSSGAVSQVKGMDGTTLTASGNNVTVPVGSYYRTAVLKFYGTGN